MGPGLAVIVSKCPQLKNVYKSKTCTKGIKEGNNRRSSVYTLHKIECTGMAIPSEDIFL